ncbi:MAG: ATP synthase F1 subunit gamma [Deltaproteobacteria bacterium]|nr:ATP synthase F1 subunit gamma [Deltaproteobacteria bacterium]
MPSLKVIKKRISSVKSTQQITKAMKMVSAAKLRKAQQAVLATRPYAKKMDAIIANLVAKVPDLSHPLLKERPRERALVLLITGDRGLCGGFNTNISKAVERFVRDNPENFQQIDVAVIGRKGNDYLKRRPGVNIVKVYENITGEVNYQTASLLGTEYAAAFTEEKYDVVYLYYNEFKSVISQVITKLQLLPVVTPKAEEELFTGVDYIFEPSAQEVLGQLLAKNVEVQIFRAILESRASEFGARMTSMDSATKNASEMIGKLTLMYNRARQAAITKELMEIISGAEAIK